MTAFKFQPLSILYLRVHDIALNSKPTSVVPRFTRWPSSFGHETANLYLGYENQDHTGEAR